MALTLQQAFTDLDNGDIELQSGVVAQITREAYVTPYENIVNYQQFVPIIYYNIIDKALTTSNTTSIQFTPDDLFVADDYVVLNRVLVE